MTKPLRCGNTAGPHTKPHTETRMPSKHGQPSLSPPCSRQQNHGESQGVTGNAGSPAATGVPLPDASRCSHIPRTPAAHGPHTVPHTPESGDRTRLDVLRATALSMRDLAEQIGASDITLTLDGGTRLTWDCDDGYHLLPPGVEELDISEWVDHAGLLPVEGVESVRQQPELLAKGRK